MTGGEVSWNVYNTGLEFGDYWVSVTDMPVTTANLLHLSGSQNPDHYELSRLDLKCLPRSNSLEFNVK